MSRTQAIGVVLILLGLVYAFVYAGWLRRGRNKAKPVETPEPVASENVAAPATKNADASEPDEAEGPEPPVASENVAAPATKNADASEPAEVAADGIAGRYLGTRVGRDQSASKGLGKAAAGTMSVGPEGVTWRPDGGTALRAEPDTVETVRAEDGSITILWHPDATTSHQTGFTADSAEGTAALLTALGELHGIPVAGATTTSDETSTTEMETP